MLTWLFRCDGLRLWHCWHYLDKVRVRVKHSALVPEEVDVRWKYRCCACGKYKLRVPQSPY